MLDITSQSISAFIDATLAGISAHIEHERDELTRGTHAERREVVTLILDGAPITRQRAEARLGYALDRTHTAAVIWTDEPGSDLSQLDRTAEAFSRAAAGTRPLTVIASAATRWVWVAGAVALDAHLLEQAVRAAPAVRVAVGPTSRGVAGFRRSHLDAITTQRMVARLRSRQRIAFFTDVQLVALLTRDPDRADEFIRHVLGDFEAAAADLHTAVLTFVNEQCNASRAAGRRYVHRNTLLRKLARADELLPRPLSENSVHVAVALEALRWRGTEA
jgi:DNA-binding PucR family transcriptional regulator